MSLRKGRLEEWEKPLTPAKFAEQTTKAHQLIQFGIRGWRCQCGNVYQAARSRGDANVRHGMHTKEVLASAESDRLGNDRYEDS